MVRPGCNYANTPLLSPSLMSTGLLGEIKGSFHLTAHNKCLVETRVKHVFLRNNFFCVVLLQDGTTFTFLSFCSSHTVHTSQLYPVYIAKYFCESVQKNHTFRASLNRLDCAFRV